MNRRPRLSVEITPEQAKKLNNLIPWGQQRAVISALVDELVDILEKHGAVAIGAVLAKRISFLSMVEAKEKRDETK